MIESFVFEETSVFLSFWLMCVMSFVFYTLRYEWPVLVVPSFLEYLGIGFRLLNFSNYSWDYIITCCSLNVCLLDWKKDVFWIDGLENVYIFFVSKVESMYSRMLYVFVNCNLLLHWCFLNIDPFVYVSVVNKMNLMGFF